MKKKKIVIKNKKEIKKKPQLEIFNSRDRKQFYKRIAEEYKSNAESIKEILQDVAIIKQGDQYFIISSQYKHEEINLHELSIYQYGLYFAKEYKKHLMLTIEAIEKLYKVLDLEKINLDENEMKTYLNGQNIILSKSLEIQNGHYLIISNYKNSSKPFIMGVAKVHENILINNIEKNRITQAY